MDVSFLPLQNILMQQFLEIQALVHSVWPPAEAMNLDQQFRELKASTAQRPEGYALVRYKGRLMASALVKERIIGTSEGDLPVMTLGAVCSDPQARGQGYGAAVVSHLFEMIDNGAYPVCLFQTSFKVEPFYERLGARRIFNQIINSRRDPSATGKKRKRQVFWDDIVMIYPESFSWPAGTIDLRGAAY